MRDIREREAQENKSSWSPSVDAVASVREDVAVVKDAMDWVAVARDKGMNGGRVSIMRGGRDIVAASRGDGPGVGRGDIEPEGKRRPMLPSRSRSGSWGGEVMGV